MSEVLHQATRAVIEDDLPRMVLGAAQLPAPLRDLNPSRSCFLDNHSLAEQGLPGSTAERFRDIGRLTGYLQEFLPAAPEHRKIPPGFTLAASTVVHLFDESHSVSRWMQEVFLRDFESRLDEEIHPGQHLLVAERLQFEGFADETAGLRVLQSSPEGPVSSTVVDFRVGRLLGVAYVVNLGNYTAHDLTHRLGQALERRMVQAILEVPR
jgi:hypothetical protein